MFRRYTMSALVLCSMALAFTLSGQAQADAPPAGTIGTFAGGGTLTGDGIPATSAALSFPYGIAVNAAGEVFFSDVGHCSVRKVSGGIITTAVGTGLCAQYPDPTWAGDGGPATSAMLQRPEGLAMDGDGNLFIADTFNCSIRKVEARTGTITTVAGHGPDGCGGRNDDGGLATSAYLANPAGVAVDANGNIYIADSQSCRVRRVTNGIISTVAGLWPNFGICSFSGDGGPATAAGVVHPEGIAVDATGNLYFVDSCRIRKVSAGVISTVAFVCGSASGSGASGPELLAVNAAGDLFIADAGNCLIRKLSDGVLTTVAGLQVPIADTYYNVCGYSGDGGPATEAEMGGDPGVAVDSGGNLYITELPTFPGATGAHVRIVYGDTPPLLGGTNAAPTISAPGAQSAHIGETVAFTLSASDADGDPLVLSESGLPAGLTFTDHGDGTGSVAGTVASAPGTYHAKFWASDGTIPAAAAQVDITITPPGSPPVLVVPGPQAGQYSDPLNFNVSATDPDGDPIQLAASGLPAGLTFVDHGDGSGSVGGVVLAPAGTYVAQFSAKDPWFPAAVRNVSITIGPEAALLVYTGDTTKSTGSALTLSAHVTQSPDGTPGDLTKLALYIDLHGVLAGTNLSYGPLAVSASGDAAVTLPAGLDIDEYAVTVRIAANGYFAASPTSALVGVYGAQTSTSGTGWVLDGGVKSDFVISAKYGPSLQGQLQYTYRENGLTMKLKSDSLQWLVVRGQTAVLRGTASLNGVSGYTFEIMVIDNGSGPADSLGVNIWRVDGSAAHTEPPTVIGGGSISVRLR